MFSREEEEAYTKTKQFIEGVNKTVQHQKDYLQHKVDEYLKNKDNSLEDRWEVWTKYSQTNSGDWIHHFEGFEEFEEWFHDGDSFNRSEEIKYSRILESYEDFLIDELDKEEVELEISHMKEYLMEQNLRSYKFDW